MKLAAGPGRKFVARPDRGARAALLYGPNRSAIAEACDAIQRALLGPCPDAFALVRLEDDALRRDRALLWDEMAAQSLLGGERLVRVKAEGDSAAETIVAALNDLESDLPAGAFLLVEGGDLATRSKIRTAFENARTAPAIALYDDEPEALVALAVGLLSGAEVRLTPEAQALLETSLPSDRALLRGETEKLILFAHGRAAPVEAGELAVLLAVEAEAALEDATAAAASGRSGPAVEALQRSGAAGVSAMRALERRLLRLVEARNLVEAGAQPADAAQKLRPPVFWKERDAFSLELRSWSLGALAAALDALWRAQLRAMTAGAPQDLIAADAFRAVAALAGRR